MKKKLIKIAIVGKTNAGKSTLLNKFTGETISIVNKKINTTQEEIIGIANYKSNQLIFYDTPGINFLKKIDKNKSKLKKGIWNGLNNSDLIIYLIDVRKYNFGEIEKIIYKLEEIKKKIIIVFNKNDLIDKNLILPMIKELNSKTNVNLFFSISAKKNHGLKNLTNYLISKTYNSKWIYNNNEISNRDDIFFSNECTRNALLDLLHEEIPYNIKINNIMFKYLKNEDLKIKQEIIIDNLRYKKIILGKNGEKIKDIRIKSQKQISKILKTKVHLYINLLTSDAYKK